MKCKSSRALIFLSTLHCKYFYACLPSIFSIWTPFLFTLRLGSRSRLLPQHQGLCVLGSKIDLVAFARCLTVISLPSKRKFSFFKALCTVSGGLSACLCMVPKKSSWSWFQSLSTHFSTGAEAITPRLTQMLYHSLSEKTVRQEGTKHLDRPCLALF